MARRERVAVIDPGSTWVTCMIGEVTDNGAIRIAGYGRSAAQGWRKGVVVHPDKATQAIAEASQAAAQMAGFRLDTVYVNVSGEHIRFIRGKGSTAVHRPRNGISDADVDNVVEQARAIALPQDEMVLHVIPIQFIVDGQKGVMEPRGLFGTRLEVEVHIIIASTSVVENIYRVVEAAGLRVRATLLRSMAAALGGTELEERNMGVALVHLGALSDVVVYREFSVRYNSTLALGGEHVTNDISLVLRIPQPLAEKLKVEYAVASASRVETDDPITIPVQNTTKQISRRLLASVVEPRVEEILLHADGEIRKSGLAEVLAAGVVLTGGGARLPGIDGLAEQIMNMPVRIGNVAGVEAPDEILTNPSYVPAVGLIRYGLRGSRDIGNAVIDPERSMPIWKRITRVFTRRAPGGKS